jgi:hypothetical protein
VLHEACPDYVPESICTKREHEEAMRVSCCCCSGGVGVVCVSVVCSSAVQQHYAGAVEASVWYAAAFCV